MGQMVSMFNERQQGNLLGTSEVNPRRDGKEHCKAIILRSGKTVEKPVKNIAENDEDNVESEEIDAGNFGIHTKTTKESARTIGKAERFLKNSASKEQRKSELKASSREDTPVIPYPQRLKKKKLDNKFGKFMEIFKKLHINIPFFDALEQMPSYVKFMKDIK